MKSSELYTLIGLAIAIIAIFLTFYQIRQGYKIQRTTLFKDLYQMMYGDPHIREAFYLIDYQKFVFANKFSSLHEEQLIDHLLNFFDLLSGLYEDKMLTKKEMNFFEYEFKIVYSNPGIQAYLKYLRGIYKNEKVATMPNHGFISYCKNELLL